MNKIMPSRRMPKHLQGTRRGLFYLLQSTPSLVGGDTTPEPAPARPTGAPAKPVSVTPPAEKPDAPGISAYLASDDFYFML